MNIQEKHKNPIAAPFELFEYLDGITPSVGIMGGRHYTTREGKEKSLNTLYRDCIKALHVIGRMQNAPEPKVKRAVMSRLSVLDKKGTENLQKASRWIRLLTVVKQCLTLSPLIRAIQQYRLNHIEVRDSEQKIPSIDEISKLQNAQNVPSKETLEAIIKEADDLKNAMMLSFGYPGEHEGCRDVNFILLECQGLKMIVENPDVSAEEIWNTLNETLQGTLKEKLQEAAKGVVETRSRLAKWTASQS